MPVPVPVPVPVPAFGCPACQQLLKVGKADGVAGALDPALEPVLLDGSQQRFDRDRKVERRHHGRVHLESAPTEHPPRFVKPKRRDDVPGWKHGVERKRHWLTRGERDGRDDLKPQIGHNIGFQAPDQHPISVGTKQSMAHGA